MPAVSSLSPLADTQLHRAPSRQAGSNKVAASNYG